MSIRLMTAIFESPEPQGARRLVLLSLADNANDEGVCWPSVATIARKAAIDERRCHRIINSLVEDGYLAITHREGKNGVYSTNIYQLLKSKITSTGTGATGTVVNRPPGGGTETTGVVAPAPPEPSFNHQLTNTSTTAAAEKSSNLFRFYEENIGPITPFIADELQELESQYTTAWVMDAIKEAAASGARNLKYIKAILARWKSQGRNAKKPVSTTRRGKNPLAEQNRIDLERKSREQAARLGITPGVEEFVEF